MFVFFWFDVIQKAFPLLKKGLFVSIPVCNGECLKVIFEVNQACMIGVMVFELAFIGQTDFRFAKACGYTGAGFNTEALHAFSVCHIA